MPERLLWMCECWEGVEPRESHRRETEAEVRELATAWQESDPGGDLRHRYTLWCFDKDTGRWIRVEG